MHYSNNRGGFLSLPPPCYHNYYIMRIWLTYKYNRSYHATPPPGHLCKRLLMCLVLPSLYPCARGSGKPCDHHMCNNECIYFYVCRSWRHLTLHLWRGSEKIVATNREREIIQNNLACIIVLLVELVPYGMRVFATYAHCASNSQGAIIN